MRTKHILKTRAFLCFNWVLRINSWSFLYVCRSIVVVFLMLTCKVGMSQLPSTGIDEITYLENFRIKKISDSLFEGVNRSDKSERCLIFYEGELMTSIIFFDEKGGYALFDYSSSGTSEITLKIATKHEKLRITESIYENDSLMSSKQIYP